LKNLVKVLGIAFVAAQAADAFLTLWAAHSLEGFQEMNPLLAPIAGTWASPLVKILPAALVAWGLVRLGRRYPKTRSTMVVGLAAVIVFYGVVLASNMNEL